MKSTDLMIGDWVNHINLDYIQVSAIDNYNINAFGEIESIDVYDIEPILLTPEILEKNGLTNHRFSDSDFADYEEWYSDDKRLRVIKDKQGMFARVEDEQLEYMKAGGIVEFVHDWQHLLKHAKIEKEIIL